MNPRVKKVVPNPDYTLKLTFNNGEEKVFDVKPYFDAEFFMELKELSKFNAVSVEPIFGTVQWASGQDFCPDTLYLESKKLEFA